MTHAWFLQSNPITSNYNSCVNIPLIIVTECLQLEINTINNNYCLFNVPNKKGNVVF